MFKRQIEEALRRLYTLGTKVRPTTWQSRDVSADPAATTVEVLNHTLKAQVMTEDLGKLAEDIEPNLPWADDHFLERVGGKPLNPGVQWARWPWGNKADTFRNVPVPFFADSIPCADCKAQGAQPDECVPGCSTCNPHGFSHTYMERMWPKKANLDAQTMQAMGPAGARVGVRYKLGDARDVVRALARNPSTRQAYLPIWFPEDTGKDDVRVPCTLGYHFIQRNGYLHCTYYIRSCDAYRHLRDDIYLTVRLQLWMLDQLRKEEGDWATVRPGMFTMHIVSLHLFVNDYTKLFGVPPP